MLPTRHDRPRRSIGRLVTTTLVAGALVAAACSGSDDALVIDLDPTTTTSTTEAPPPAGNGRLTIGVLLPTTGAGAQLGGPMVNAVRLAVERIDDAGGVLGEPIELIERDEGGTVSSAGIGLDELIAEGVDAIVGPASSLAALAVLDSAVLSGILTCSPTATALALDEYPDNGLFFRTVPSDSLQAIALSQIAQLTGATEVVVTHLDDAFGRGLAGTVTTALTARSLQVVDRVGIRSGAADLDARLTEAIEDAPGVIVVLGDADTGSQILAALGRVLAGRSGPLPRILVNDAVRAARATQAILELPDRVRAQITGIAPAAIVIDRDDLPGPYAAHAYDCVNLIALAAERAGTDAPARIAAQMAAVSVGGSVCRTYQSCVDRLAEGLQIDYQGPSGRLELSTRTGNPTVGRFETFTFDDDGRDVSGPPFDVSSR